MAEMEKEGRPPESKRSRKPAHPVKREINEEMKVCWDFGAGATALFLPPAPFGPLYGFGGTGERLSVPVGCPGRLRCSSRCRTEAGSRAASSGFAYLRFGGGGGGRRTTHSLTVSTPGWYRRVPGGGVRRPKWRWARPRGFASRRCSFFRVLVPPKLGAAGPRHPGALHSPVSPLPLPATRPRFPPSSQLSGVKGLSVPGRVAARAARVWVPF